jgi:beta-lactamase superfamily II metal-dependent hydrolase
MIEDILKDQKAYNEEVLITLESYSKKNNEILFDFLDLNSFLKFNESLDLEMDDPRGPSMLLITNFKDTRRFNEGVYYKINEKTLKELREQITLENESSVIKYRIDFLSKEIKDLVTSSRISNEYLSELTESHRKGDDDINLISISNGVGNFVNLKLIVRHVGQGSWNEFVFDGHPRIIYDIGTSYQTKKIEVKKLISFRETDYQLAKPIIILSHWDVDHYHLLLQAEDDTIKSINYFLYRSKIPNKTSNDLLDRFKQLNPNALIPIRELDDNSKVAADRLEKLFTFHSSFTLYNGAKNRNRNKGGILLTYFSKKICVVCGADFHYSQLNNFVLADLNFPHNHYLIVPHHGGEAGKVCYKLKNANFKDAIISVGYNIYNHPFQWVKDELQLIKFNPVDFRIRQPHHNYELNLKS